MPPLSTKKQDVPPPSQQQGFALSEEDVLALMTQDSSDSRIDILKKVATGHASGNFNPRELALADQIFRIMLKDAELKVRTSLAECIKNNPNTPRDVVMALAKDVEEVSLPVLKYSEVLNDSDLVDIIRSSASEATQIAVSERAQISERVSTALIDTQAPSVIKSLVSNKGAQIADNSYQKIVLDHRDNPDLLSSLAQRPSLPITVVEKLISVVSGSIAAELEKKYKITDITQQSEQTREITTLKLLDDADIPEEEIERLVNQLHTFGRLNTSFIVTALCRGNYRFFEQSLAKLARINASNARMLINDRGSHGFQALYNKAGMPESMFPAVKLVLGVVRELLERGEQPGTITYANRMVERIFFHAEGKEIDNLSYILALVRQNVNH